MNLREKLPVLMRDLQDLRKNKSAYLIAIALAGFMAYYLDAHETAKSGAAETEPADAATFIPAGFVLVPIEVANYESLDSILGPYGIVDLFLPQDETHKRAQKIASHLKILRAPLNPSHFAVLAPEEDSPKLVAHAGPYMVIVQNPKSHGTGIVSGSGNVADEDAERLKKKPPHSSRIKVEVPDAQEG